MLENESNKINVLEKKILTILFSPFKQILMYILSNNITDIEECEDFEYLYEEIKGYINLPDNIIFCQKYFDLINFSDYKEFLRSCISICEKISKINMILSQDIMCWGLDINSVYRMASIDIIKILNKDVICYKLKKKSKILYINKKIVINDEKFIFEDNNDIIFDVNSNKLVENESVDIVNNYKPIIKEVIINNKTVLLVNDIKELGSYKYKNCEVGAYSNDEFKK